MEAFPNLKERRRALAGHAVGRRAAGDGDRPRADDEPGPPAPRRGVARLVAADRRSPLRPARGAEIVGRRDGAGRAGPEARHGDREPRHLHAGGRDRDRRADQRAHPRAGHGSLFRPQDVVAREAPPHDLPQPDHPGRAARRLLRADRLRAVVHVRGHAASSISRMAAWRCWPPTRCIVLADRFGMQPFLGLCLVAPAMALVGWALQRLVLERSARGGLLVPVLSTFGLVDRHRQSRCSRGSAPTPVRSRPTSAISPTTAGRSADDDRDRQARGADHRGRGCVCSAASRPFSTRTLIGRAIRATAEDPDTVGLVGVNARRVNAIAAAIALATVAVAGAFLGMRATFDPYAGAAQLIFAFEASVIGGAGSLWGTLAGGIVLGVAQSLGRARQSAGLLHRRPLRLSRRPVRAAVLRRPRPARPDGAHRETRRERKRRRRGRALDARVAHRDRRALP